MSGFLRRPGVIALFISAIVIVLWQSALAPRTLVVPSPSEIGSEIKNHWDTYWPAVVATARTAAKGLVVGCGIAIFLAACSLLARPIETVLLRLGVALYSVPIIVVAPLLILWLGQGDRPRIAVAALAVFFGVLVNSIRGLRSATPESSEFFHVVSANGLQTLRHLRVPSSLPFFFSALKVAMPAAVFGTIIGEWIGANKGLGVTMYYALYQFNVPQLWTAMALSTAIALGGYLLVGVVERIVIPWHESVRASRLETG